MRKHDDVVALQIWAPTSYLIALITTSVLYFSDSFSIVNLISIFLISVSVTIVSQFKKRDTENYINPITLLAVLFISFFIPASNFNRLLILTLLLCFFYRRPLNFHTIPYPSISWTYICILSFSVLYMILSEFSDYILQFLTFGYDHAFHFSSYRGYLLTNWFPFFSTDNWWTDFELFRRSPTGSSAFFSFVSLALPIRLDDSSSLLVGYASILLSLLIGVVFLIFKLTQLRVEKTSLKPLLFLLSSFLMLYSMLTLITNGFPPYALSVFIILLWYYVDLDLPNLIGRLATYLSAVFLLLLITPAPLGFMVIPGLKLVIELFILLKKSQNKKLLPSTLFVLASFTFMVFELANRSSASFGWRQLLEPGGVHQPSILFAILIGLGSIYMITKSAWTVLYSDQLFLIVISGALSVFGLSLLTFLNTGEIRYYAVKQYYVWSAISVIFIVLKLEYSLTKSAGYLGRFYIAFTLGVVLILLSSSFKSESPFMGELPSVLRATLDKSSWQYQIVDSNVLTYIDRSSKKGTRCILNRVNPQESDLNSRWANAVSRNFDLSEECFGIYWNSSALEFEGIIERIRVVDRPTLVYVPESLKPIRVPGNLDYRLKIQYYNTP